MGAPRTVKRNDQTFEKVLRELLSTVLNPSISMMESQAEKQSSDTGVRSY